MLCVEVAVSRASLVAAHRLAVVFASCEDGL